MDGTSPTPQQEKLNRLKQVLPEVFAEGKVDWEKLKATLGEDINFSNERYVLNWAGKSEAYKAGYKTIADIAKERLRRAGKKIQEEHPNYKGDLGFKVFKLAGSHFKQWQHHTGKDTQGARTERAEALEKQPQKRSNQVLLQTSKLVYDPNTHWKL